MRTAAPQRTFSPGLRCEVFCRVVDNLGDAAVCWRLCRQLATEQGWSPRLWIDAPQVLQRLVPHARAGHPHSGVQIEHWRGDDPRLLAPNPSQMGQVVIAAFACDLPPGYRKALRTHPAVWLNLEYLSAEGWVDGHHGLPSPKPDGGIEHFFFPGFTPASGGLLREADSLARRDAFMADPGARTAFLAQLGIRVEAGERLASLFCYPNAPVNTLLAALHRDISGARWRVLVPAGVQVGDIPRDLREALVTPIPFVPQLDYDPLLWSCELNWVRGEDSLVRALWSGRPFLWQAYRQHDDAHLAKLQALIQQWVDVAQPDAQSAQAWKQAMLGWNTVAASADPQPEPDTRSACLSGLLRHVPALHAASQRWSAAQSQQPDLVSRLVAFVGERL